MRGLRSPITATWVSLRLAVLAASCACFLCMVPANPAQSQGIPTGQRGNPPEGRYVGNVAPDEEMVMLELPRVVTNSHINVPVASGDKHPKRMAVQVVPYNQVQPDWTHAKWMPYSSNVDLDLGESDGKKMAYIRGEWDDGKITVMGVPVTLVRSLPVIAVTNPPSSLTAQPMIQLKGYCDRPLTSIHFDVVNESGTYTVQDGRGMVNGQDFDPKLFQFTTNYFTCYDIDLSRGTNTIVLRCTDNAGNTTTTNFSFVFTTLGHTNPPIITLDVPVDGGLVAGSEFVIRGYSSDPTATIMAWVTDPQRQTLAREAVVERDGRYWVEHIPAPEGTDYVSLIAFDAATNSSVTNFTVRRSHSGLRLDPPPAVSNQLAVTVTGFRDRTNFTVWVNGVQAVVQTNGKWKAERVPVSPGGVAIFRVSEHPIDTNAPDPDADTNVPPPIYWGQATNQIQAGVYFPAPPTNQADGYACDLYVMNTSGSNQNLSWVRPKENARFIPYLYSRNGINVPMTTRDEPLELLPNARMNIHHLGKREADLIDGVLDLPANTPVRLASIHLADWFSLSPGQYILDIGPQLFHVNETGDLVPFDAARVETNITVVQQP